MKQLQETGPGAGWAVHWDPHHEAPFMYRWVVTQHIARAVFISFNNVSGIGSGSWILISGPSQQNPCLTVAMMDAGPGLTLLGSTATLQTVRISFLGAVAHVRQQTARSKYHGDFCED